MRSRSLSACRRLTSATGSVCERLEPLRRVGHGDRRQRQPRWCVVAQIPNGSGHRNYRQMFNAAERLKLQIQFDQDRTARLSGGRQL